MNVTSINSLRLLEFGTLKVSGEQSTQKEPYSKALFARICDKV